MASSTTTHTTILNTLLCADCGMPFGIPVDFEQRRRDDGKTFYCPKGCKNVYRQSEVERLREQVARAERQRDWAQASRTAADDQARAAEYRRRAAVGQVTRMRNKLARGECPACEQTFPDLAGHMAEQHPEETADA